MYVIDGIAYAGEPHTPIKISGVKPLDNYRLWLRFSTGETKTFDFAPLLDKPAFKPLRDKAVFNGVYIDYGVTVWNDGDIDIAPEYLYEHGEPNDTIYAAITAARKEYEAWETTNIKDINWD